MPLNLDEELIKLDMKFSPHQSGASRFSTGHFDIDFWIRYCSPGTVGMRGEGIAVCIHRFKPDKTGSNNLAVLDGVFPLSMDGLREARDVGLAAARQLYDLPSSIEVIEANSFPKPSSMRYDVIYRINMLRLLTAIGQQRP